MYVLDKYDRKLRYVFDGELLINSQILDLGLATSFFTEDLKYDSSKLSINKNNWSFKLVKNNSHPNFYLIDLINDKKNIDVSQIREMIAYTNKSAFNSMARFILIDNIENLNKNSINALLKRITTMGSLRL